MRARPRSRIRTVILRRPVGGDRRGTRTSSPGAGMNLDGWRKHGIAGAGGGVGRAAGRRGATQVDPRRPTHATRHSFSAPGLGERIADVTWVSARQPDGDLPSRCTGASRGDGTPGVPRVSARKSTLARTTSTHAGSGDGVVRVQDVNALRRARLVPSPFTGVGRGDGLHRVPWINARQPSRLVRSPSTGFGPGDGLTGAQRVSARLPNRLVRSPFTGIGRGDGLIGAQQVSARQRGFSLLEMLLVMALIAATGLLAAGVLTGGFDRMALRSGAKDVAAQLRFARAHAIATGVPQRFQIDPAARTWQGADGRAGEVPGEVQVRFTGAREVQPAAGIGAIVFFGDGASTGGRVQLSLRDAAWNVDVAWLTGEVTLRRGEVVR